MNRLLTKRGRKRLTPEAYQELHQEILRRDGWRCQSCGCSKDLQVHHLEARSQLGGDTEDNLMTLCGNCHGRRHRRTNSGDFRHIEQPMHVIHTVEPAKPRQDAPADDEFHLQEQESVKAAK